VSAFDSLRKERNKVHVDAMVNENIFHEEFKLVEVREKWDRFLKLIEDLIKNSE
jgi:hypothetical protein